MLFLELERVLDLLDLLPLSVKLLLLGLLLRQALPLDPLVQINILLVHLSFLGEDVFDLAQSHLLETLQVLDPAVGYRDVNDDLIVLLVQLPCDLFLLLWEVDII
mmetsp:Transcript_29629/g.28854  ORF Transcript_29629/g.28854 Transcript_29629/m.28854 type:complete len:105 (-) Transcript_29629:848-1162(-)